MCIIEQKKYYHSDGHQEIIETLRLCSEARHLDLRQCSNIERRTVDSARVVERRPRGEATDPSAMFITQGPGERETVCQPVSRRRSIERGPIRRRMMDRPYPVHSPSSGSSSSYVEMVPPTPSPLAIPIRRPTMSGVGSDRTIAPDGTAIYPRVTLRDLPRAAENERQTRIVEPRSNRCSSISSTAAERGEAVPRSRRQQGPAVVDTSGQPSSSTSPTVSSPGLSSLPGFETRHDSAQDLPTHRRWADTNDGSRPRYDCDDDNDDLQRFRDRLAETDRRQERRTASVERHRVQAAAALEGDREHRRRQGEQDQRGAERRANLEAELRQTDREREAAEQRRRESAQAARQAEVQHSPRSSRRTTGSSYGSYNPSPLSARSPTFLPQPVTVHQDDPPVRRYGSLRERGHAVIAREQTRAERAERASGRLSAAMRDMAIGDAYEEGGEYELDDYHIQDRFSSRESRKKERDADRAERRRDFWL